jgi:RNA polymerase sigma-70 factor, ECF subfamily
MVPLMAKANPAGGSSADTERLNQWMVAYQSGDHLAAADMIRELHPTLVRHYFVRTMNWGLAEDLAQECWMRVHRARASFRPTEPVLPWLFAIARNTRADYYRRERSRPQAAVGVAAEPSSDPRGAMESRLMAAHVVNCLDELPPAQREMFLLMKVEGLSVDQAARTAGITPQAAKQKAYRAYEKLRSMLGGKGGTA